jgi:hypothetical protein
VRFRLRAVFVATTVAAVLSAIGGAYLRRAPAAAQGPLLLYWLSLTTLAVVGLWLHWRSGWRLPVAMDTARFVLWSTRTQGTSFWRQPVGNGVMAFFWLVVVGAESAGIVDRMSHMNPFGWFRTAVFPGCLHGLMFGGAIVALLRRPLFLTEKGVWTARAWGSWKHIRYAEWLSVDPSVLKFRRIDGDFFVEVPPKLRSDVTAFVRRHTTLRDDAQQDGNLRANATSP